ncbi:MAG: hypothetical protein P4N41_14565 [Negativicutes bacterium]|nr:hypothetical protein [Negativicutes bacterium]
MRTTVAWWIIVTGAGLCIGALLSGVKGMLFFMTVCGLAAIFAIVEKRMEQAIEQDKDRPEDAQRKVS